MQSLLGTSRRPDVIFRADGHFDITARVVRALAIAPGDVVDILSDGCEFYLYVVRHARAGLAGRYRARVFPSKKGGRHFRGSSIRLCRAMLAAAGARRRAALLCGDVFTDSHGRLLIPVIVRINLAQNDY